VPIKPKTDPAFLLSLVHTILFEHEREALDLPFLRDRTAAPYLVGPDGYYLRDPATGKPLMWDKALGGPVPFDTEGVHPALEGRFTVADAVTRGPDDERRPHRNAAARTAFTAMADGVQNYTPEWAAAICDIPAETIRRVAGEFLENACVGETIEIDGETLPFRPVAVTLGKTVNNGWGAYECC
jgi:phenylacetyl-CoA:acceptor oxidoreductase